MRLVTFEEPVRRTLQGDGILLGTPMTFVRLWGCSTRCEWCDTKSSWAPGSTWVDKSVPEVLGEVRSIGIRHVAITGGEPMEQEPELSELVSSLGSEGYFVLLETQASLFSARVFKHVDLASLGPKLHQWPERTLSYIMQCSHTYGKRVQIKVVCGDYDQALQAIKHFAAIHEEFRRWHGAATYILLPEYSRGRDGVRSVYQALMDWTNATDVNRMDVRIIPQVHKLALFVS